MMSKMHPVAVGKHAVGLAQFTPQRYRAGRMSFSVQSGWKVIVPIRINSSYSFWMSGSGLLWCWGFLRFFWSHTVPVDSGGSVLGDLPYLGSTLLVSLVIASMAHSASSRQFQMRLASLGCLLLMLGIVMNFGSEVIEANAADLRLLADIAQGGGIGVSFIAWGCLYAHSETEAVECAFLGWFPLLAVLLIAVAGINLLEQGAPMLYSCLLSLLPLVSLVCFRISVRRVDAQGDEAALLDGGPRKGESTPVLSRSAVFPLINLMFVFAATSLAWNAFLFHKAIHFEVQIILFAIGVAMLFVIVWLALRMTRRFSLSTLYRWALPLFAVGAVLYQFSATVYVVPVFLCLIMVNTGFEVMSKLFCIYVAKRNSRYAIGIIAIGFAAASVGGILGSGLWAGVLNWFGTGVAGSTLLVALVAFVFAASLALGRDYDSQGSMANLVQACMPPREYGGQGTLAAFGHLNEVDGENLEAEPAARALTDADRADGCVCEKGSAPGGLPSDDAVAGASSMSIFGGGAVVEDQVTAQCVIAAEQYGLSSRELEVLFLLSQGRSRAHIRETLYISKGTVDSHIHHIYSKMGIASKDELMRRLLD